MASKVVAFRVDPKLDDAIRAAAEARGQEVSEYLRDLAAFAQGGTTPCATVADVRSLSASDLVMLNALEVNDQRPVAAEMVRRAAASDDERRELLAALIAFTASEDIRGRPRFGNFRIGLFQLKERSEKVAADIDAARVAEAA